jgi:hypothetical protein
MTRSMCTGPLTCLVIALELVAGCNRRDTPPAAPPAENARRLPEFVKPRPGPTGFVVPPEQADAGTPVVEPEWRWGRVDEDPPDGGRYRPTRSDWHDEPDNWELHAVEEQRSIPVALREPLRKIDCTLPQARLAAADVFVTWGEFERPGQRDVAVLCVHADHSSNVYMFWNADPARMETMPISGSFVAKVDLEELRSRIDSALPRQPDMPAAVTHDGLEVGCCECCSGLYYRHEGKWFSLPGAD